jgi:4-hydroxy-4-methyl-2-oxoglutarate aldolase
VNLSIVVGGLCVKAGYVVIGDIDGVVVVPYERLNAVIDRLTAIRASEAALVARVKAGLGVPDWVNELFSSGKVREVD